MPVRAPRKDAIRNRALLVDAAARAFREDGLGVSVNAIADRAGVNVATLYRHFPTKDDLVVAVLETVLEPLAAARDRALAEHDARDVLPTFLRAAVRMKDEHKGLVDALGAHPTAGDVRRRLRELAMAIVAPLVERAHREGELRAEFDALDLLLALRMLAAAVTAPDLPAARLERYVGLVARGLRAGH